MVTEIVDAQVYFRNPEVNPRYPMLAEVMPAIAHWYLPPEYGADSAGLESKDIVHVSATTEPRAFLAQARWLDALRFPVEEEYR